jgi:hypothetical protein
MKFLITALFFIILTPQAFGGLTVKLCSPACKQAEILSIESCEIIFFSCCDSLKNTEKNKEVSFLIRFLESGIISEAEAGITIRKRACSDPSCKSQFDYCVKAAKKQKSKCCEAYRTSRGVKNQYDPESELSPMAGCSKDLAVSITCPEGYYKFIGSSNIKAVLDETNRKQKATKRWESRSEETKGTSLSQ